MRKKITELTDAQKAFIPDCVDLWTRIGLSTAPADRMTAERGILETYSAAKFRPPKIVWCESPMAICLVRCAAQKVVGASLRDSVGVSVWASLGASLHDSVSASVHDSVGASVWDSVGAPVHASVWDSVGVSVRDSVWDSVGVSVRDSVWDSVWQSCYGQHDAGRLAFYDFFRAGCGLVEETRLLPGHLMIGRSAGWWLPYRDICWISERPCVLNRNTSGRLHCVGGPAMQYLDGWAIWALNGVRVPQELAEGVAEHLDVRRWVAEETNAEVRREAVGRIGVERVCESLGARVIDKAVDHAGQPCELLMLHIGDRRRPYIKLRNPSLGVYHIEGVPTTCLTVREALAFRNGREEGPRWIT